MRQLGWLAAGAALLAVLFVSDGSRRDLSHSHYVTIARSLASKLTVSVSQAFNDAGPDPGDDLRSLNCDSVNNGAPTNGCIAHFMTGAEEKPGPSARLFAAPFYSCVRNFYVATDGNDANSGTPERPWRTIRRADQAAGGRIAGDCVNVRPGVYPDRTVITHGGDAPTPTGYVVYRCTELDACRLTDSKNAFSITTPVGGPNFIVVDGFELAANSYITYGVGIAFGNLADPKAIGNHHIWIINNIIHGYGQSGIDGGAGEYYYVLHNLSYENSRVTCDAQGSGIAIVAARTFPSYAPNHTDILYAPFRNIIAWNVSRDNQLTRCGSAANPYDTDGNGIIIDTFNNAGSIGVLYPYQTLVAFNVVHNNGGSGVHVFRSSFVTVANNTAYNNNLDPYTSATALSQINILGGHKNRVINNIAYSEPATSPSDPRCHGVNYSGPPWLLPKPCPLQNSAAFLGGSAAGEVDADNLWSNNISYGGTPPYVNQRGNAIWPPDSINCTTAGRSPNKCNVDPGLVDPLGNNFTLRAGSPAIGFGRLAGRSVDAGACDHKLTSCP